MFITRNAPMVHIVNFIRFKMVYTSRLKSPFIFIFNFRLLLIPHSSAKLIDMKLSMSFIHSNRSIEIDSKF